MRTEVPLAGVGCGGVGIANYGGDAHDTSGGTTHCSGILNLGVGFVLIQLLTIRLDLESALFSANLN